MIDDTSRQRWLERLGVLLILLAAALPRARDLRAPFDREFEGAQASFFALGAINYERLGLARSGGYPVVNIDLGPREDALRGLWEHPQSWYVYANHPPLVPLLAWSALKLGAAPGWDEAWREERAPRGIEPWIRAPFLAANLLGLLALWWALRQAAGPRRALIALGIAAALPISIVYGTLVNYENPVLLCIALAAGFYARWIRRERRRDLLLCTLAFAAGGAVTFSALFFIPPLALHAVKRRGWRRGLYFSTLASLCGLAPILLHSAWSSIVMRRLGMESTGLGARARELWAPLFDGSHPLHEWAGLQAQRISTWFTWPIVLVACLALAASAFALARRLPPRDGAACEPAGPIELEPALLGGGCLYLVAFYRHTFDPQFTFLMLLVPGVAGLVALALDRAAERWLPSRSPNAPLAIATCALALLGVQRANQLRFEFRALAGETRSGSDQPALPMPDMQGAEIATLVPAGGFGIHPAQLGLNTAVSFYAWRSLWPANSAHDTLPAAVAERFGLAAREHVLLLPKHPWPSIAPAIEAFERERVGGAAPDRESEHWRAWKLH